MKAFKFLSIAVALLLITGCAVGNRYDYRQANASLPLKSTGDVSVGVVDQRSYVLSGEKGYDFVGLQRGGFGNPFEVKTTSGKALKDDMTDVLANALKGAGFTVNKLYFSSPDSTVIGNVVATEGQEKNVILKVNDWKTDAMMNFRLIYNLVLTVVDKKGNILATNTSRGDEKLSGAGFESHNSRTAAAAFDTKVSRLFNNPEIISALKK